MKNRLILVTTAGSATTGPLELPTLGADVGPGRQTIQFKTMASQIQNITVHLEIGYKKIL